MLREGLGMMGGRVLGRCERDNNIGCSGKGRKFGVTGGVWR